jgi:hypothetical protein
MSVKTFVRRPIKPVWYRPALEELERRLAPAAMTPFSTLASGLGQALTSIVGTVAQDGPLIQDVKQVQAALPILGQSLAQQATSVRTAMNGIVTSGPRRRPLPGAGNTAPSARQSADCTRAAANVLASSRRPRTASA